jgi:hypothetical protein
MLLEMVWTKYLLLLLTRSLTSKVLERLYKLSMEQYQKVGKPLELDLLK